MIQALNVCKNFEDIKAVDDISLEIKDGSVFGLIGTNGAGKSTFLRMMAGVLKPDQGTVLLDQEPVYENRNAKCKLFYISDEQFFLQGSTPDRMKDFYKSIYENFSEERFNAMMERFDLDKNRKISTFSKGMKKQLSVILGISAGTKYLFCDETFDGLDPVMRQGVKSLFAAEMEDRDFTPIIASHNLRELEDICEHVGLLHKGGVLLAKDLEDMKTGIHKVQCVLDAPEKEALLKERLDIVSYDKRGSLYTLTVRGTDEIIMQELAGIGTIFAETLPLTLEEIFISETGVYGYEIKKLIG